MFIKLNQNKSKYFRRNGKRISYKKWKKRRKWKWFLKRKNPLGIENKIKRKWIKKRNLRYIGLEQNQILINGIVLLITTLNVIANFGIIVEITELNPKRH